MAVPVEEPVRTAVEAASADSSAVAVAEPADNSESEPAVPVDDKHSAEEP